MISKKYRTAITAAVVVPGLMLGACSKKEDEKASTTTSANGEAPAGAGSITISG